MGDADAHFARSLLDQQFGNYRLLRLLGQGGFADVYLGQHVHLRNLAAIKILRGNLRQAEIERFYQEARMVARLVHPHIVRVLEFGIEHTRPFFVMDYAPNGSMAQRYPPGTPLTLTLILPYVLQAADALHYAHQQRLIHCDVKPENLLLDGNDELLLGDFGIATIAHTSLSATLADLLGTVEYMAPEQLQGRPRPASDQYALAAVIYTWLTGVPPFRGTFKEVAAGHLSVAPQPFCEWGIAVSAELEAVVMRALAKEPLRRFASMHEFAQAFTQAAGVVDASSVALRPLKRVPLADRGHGGQTEPIGPQDERYATVQVVTSELPAQVRQRFSRRGVLVAGATGVALAAGGLSWVVLTQRLSIMPARSGQRDPAASPAVQAKPPGTTLLTYSGHFNRVTTVAWSPNGQQLASGGLDRRVLLWDARSGNTLVTYREHSDPVSALAWSPDGSRLVSVGGSSSNASARVWHASNGRTVRAYAGHIQNVTAVAWSPDGSRIASASDDQTVQVWEASSGKTLVTYRGHANPVAALAWSPDSKYIVSAVGSQDNNIEQRTVKVWVSASGKDLLTYYETLLGADALAWLPDGRTIIMSNRSGILLWELPLGTDVRAYHDNVVPWTLALAANGRRIVSGGSTQALNNDGYAQVRDLSSGRTLLYHGQLQTVDSVAWSPDGQRIASGSFDRTVQIWQAF